MMALIKWAFFVHFSTILLAISFDVSFAKAVESTANYNSSSCNSPEKLLVKCLLDEKYGKAQVCYPRMLLPNVEHKYKPSKRFQLGQMDCDGQNMKDGGGLLNYQNLWRNLSESVDQINKGAYVDDLVKGARFMPEECYQDCGDSPQCTAKPTPPDIMPRICEMPWKKKFSSEMKVNGKIVIKGRIRSNAVNIIITLLHNGPDWDENIRNSVVMKMEANFVNGLLTISSYDEKFLAKNAWFEVIPDPMGGWNASDAKENPFKEGQQFQLEIDVLEESLIIQLNGQIIADYAHRVDVWKMNWLRIEGGICLHGEPIVRIPEIHGTNFIMDLTNSRLLRVGDKIEIVGIVPYDAKFFKIDFLHETDNTDYLYTTTFVPMMLRFYFLELGEPVIRPDYAVYIYYHGPNMAWLRNETGPVNRCIAIRKGELFTLEFLVTAEAYNITYSIGNNNDKKTHFLDFNHKHEIIYIPYWTADLIRIMGDVNITSGPIVIHTEIDDPKILQVYRNSSDVGLEPGDVIKINGIMHGNAQIGLFYRALRRYLFHNFNAPLYIELIPHYNNDSEPGIIDTVDVIVTTYVNKQGVHEFKSKHRNVSKQLEIQIEVAEEFYNITMFSSNHTVIFSHIHYRILPIWSVEYIVVEDEFDGKIKLMKGGKNTQSH